MVESTSPPPVVAYFGPDPANWPNPAMIAVRPAASLMDRQAEEFLDAATTVMRRQHETLLSDVVEPPPLKDFTLTVTVTRNENGEIGQAREQLSTVDIADKPGLVRLAGTLGDAAYENLEKTD